MKNDSTEFFNMPTWYKIIAPIIAILVTYGLSFAVVKLMF